MFSYSDVNTNPSLSSRLSCEFFSNRCASLRDDPIILPIRKINSKFSQRCLFRSSQVVFVFPHPPTLFFKDSFILIKYPFIHVKSLHSFQSMFWSSDPSWRCSRASSSSSSVFLLRRWIQFKLSVLIIFLSSCQMLSHAGAPLNHSPLAINLLWSAEDISQDLCFHS